MVLGVLQTYACVRYCLSQSWLNVVGRQEHASLFRSVNESEKLFYRIVMKTWKSAETNWMTAKEEVWRKRRKNLGSKSGLLHKTFYSCNLRRFVSTASGPVAQRYNARLVTLRLRIRILPLALREREKKNRRMVVLSMWHFVKCCFLVFYRCVILSTMWELRNVTFYELG